MGMGTLLVAGIFLSRLTQAMRAQTADLVTVAEMANGVTGVEEFACATCDGLRQSAGADFVAMLEPAEKGEELRVTAIAGDAEPRLLQAESMRKAIAASYAEGAAVAADGHRAARRLVGGVHGLAQPILRDGKPAGVLALGWATPRRVVGPRVETAALLFAAEASVALDRAERLSREKERRALEINDNIVQGLVVAKYAAQAGQSREALRAIDETLARARRLITDALGDEVTPGDLVRDEAPSL
jgi:GAF domain-containing protein